MNLINFNELKFTEMLSSSSDEKFSKYSNISNLLGLNKIFITKEILKPGRRLSSKHYHTTKEEIFIVLNGNPTLIINKDFKQLKKGDIIGFEPNLPEFHTIKNSSSSNVELLILSSQDNDDEIIYETE